MLSPTECKDLNMNRTECEVVRPYHDLSDLGRYFLSPTPSKFLIYSTRNTIPDIKKFPHIEAHLHRFKPIMERRRETLKGSNQWWHLHWPREPQLWITPKIISMQMASRPSFAIADTECYTSFSTNVVVPKNNNEVIRYALLGLLNSKVIWYWLSQVAKKRGVGLEINGHTLQDIPVPKSLDPGLPEIVEIAELARERTEMEIALRGARLSSQQVVSERQRMSLIEARIDGCALRLYDLSEADLSSIEASLAGGEIQKRGRRRRQPGA
jgi:TaqI-like C-terminal specificity domain